MFATYIIIAGIIGTFALILGGVTTVLGFADGDVEQRRFGTILLGPGILIAGFWPLVVALAFPAAVLYGGWTLARAIKHKSLDF